MRKFVFNYYARKKYLLALEVRNEVVRYESLKLVSLFAIHELALDHRSFILCD